MIRRYMAPLKAALVFADAISAALLFLGLASLRFDFLGGTWNMGEAAPLDVAITYGLMWVGALWLLGLYRLRRRWTLRGEIVDVLRASSLLIIASLAVLYVFRLTEVSRLFVAMLFVSQPIVTIALRSTLRLALERLRSRGKIARQMLIIGAGREAENFANAVEERRELGLSVLGHLRTPHEGDTIVSRPVIGTIDQIEDVLKAKVVDEVAVCLAPRDWSYVEPATRTCELQGKIVRVSIQALGGMLASGQFDEVAGIQTVTYVYGPDRVLRIGLKRLADLLVSAIGLVVLSPVILIVAACVRFGDGPPVIYRHQRVGLHGRPFMCLKFRTMIPGAEATQNEIAHLSEISGPAFKISNDPRVTRVGLWLRRFSLDELPQLWNVLRGDMSIVGPRPAPPAEVDRYDAWHRRRLSMRPGITGLWQVSARNDHDFDRRANLDLYYIDNWSIWMDLKILLKTIPAVARQQGQ